MDDIPRSSMNFTPAAMAARPGSWEFRSRTAPASRGGGGSENESVPVPPNRTGAIASRVLQVKSTGAWDAEQGFMAGEDVGIDREVPENDRNMTGGLCPIHNEVNPMVMQYLSNF